MGLLFSVRACIGFLSEVDAQLMEEARVVEEVDRFVVLSWDEIKIKEGLVYIMINITVS